MLSLLPSRCQRLLFSATLPASVLWLAEDLLHEPTRIEIDAGRTTGAASITQRAIEVDAGKRTLLLRHLLATCACCTCEAAARAAGTDPALVNRKHEP